MRELHTTAVVDDRGELSVKVPTDLAPGAHRLTLIVDEQLQTDPEPASAGLLRLRLAAFLEDWDNPEMAVYDRL